MNFITEMQILKRKNSQLEAKLKAKDELLFAYESTRVPNISSLRAKLNRTCEWVVDEDGIFDTGCGNKFEFIYDGPEENHFTYCPYCGGKLAVYDGHS